MRTFGTSLLALGFVLVAGAVLLRDPVAKDANIGAGILSLVGLPVGALGLVLLLADAVRAFARGRTARGVSTE